ncbi:MAG: hypothetical protein WCU00_05805 [Candidatus Latescibacterota bacterium]
MVFCNLRNHKGFAIPLTIAHTTCECTVSRGREKKTAKRGIGQSVLPVKGYYQWISLFV